MNNGMETAGVLAIAGLGLAVSFLLLLVARELVAWYLKINLQLAELQKLNATMASVDKNLALLSTFIKQRATAEQPQEDGEGP